MGQGGNRSVPNGTALPAAVLALNAADAAFTTLFLRADVATEANPVMRAAWALSPSFFLAFKLLVVAAGVLVLFRLRVHLLAWRGLQVAFLAYAAVVALHLVFLGTVVPFAAVWMP